MKKLLKTGLAISALTIAQSGPTLAASGDDISKLGVSLQIVAKKAEENAALATDDKRRVADRSSFGRVGPNKKAVLATVTTDGYVIIDAVASGDPNDLAVTIESLGGKNIATYGRHVSAKIPAERLADLASSGYLAFARPASAKTNIGLVTSEGDHAMRTDLTRASHGLNGAGMTIGVLSDSYACDPGSANTAGAYTTPDEDVQNGDINDQIIILEDYHGSTCFDEGRAMAQLIQDVLPEARIAFHTAFIGEADFAQGIIELAQAGADVIVDDIIYFTEPMFQDGIITQAADQVTAWGIPYLSSNGNDARDSYESEFVPFRTINNGLGGIWHDFHPGGPIDTLATFTTPSLTNGVENVTRLVFNWDSPNFSVSGGDGAQNNIDIIMFDKNGRRVPDCYNSDDDFLLPFKGLCVLKSDDGGDGLDALEQVFLFDFNGNSEVQLGFYLRSGSAPGFVKFVMFGDVFVDAEYGLGGSTGYGHSNAAGAESVGAAAVFFTEEFDGDPKFLDLRTDAGEPACIPACLNDFSSAGGTPIFFDIEGNRLATPEIRLKPGITGPDGSNNTFFRADTFRDDDDGDGEFLSDEVGEYPNFFGTSASAPHVAALVGQLINWEGTKVRTTNSKKEKEAYNICKLAKGSTSRSDGETMVWLKDRALGRLEKGNILLRSCEATEPAELFQVIRDTAQDMSVRADVFTGETIDTFPDSPDGFDFDSGFGFVDGEAALESFTKSK